MGVRNTTSTSVSLFADSVDYPFPDCMSWETKFDSSYYIPELGMERTGIFVSYPLTVSTWITNGIGFSYIHRYYHWSQQELYYLSAALVNGIQYGTFVNTENERYLPANYFLKQNYPNPFNPTTTIQYELPQRSDVQITIYDLLGRKVATLVSETQHAGYKSVQWDATNNGGQQVSAGVYLYQIKADGFVETRKMVLLR